MTIRNKEINKIELDLDFYWNHFNEFQAHENSCSIRNARVGQSRGIGRATDHRSSRTRFLDVRLFRSLSGPTNRSQISEFSTGFQRKRQPSVTLVVEAAEFHGNRRPGRTKTDIRASAGLASTSTTATTWTAAKATTTATTAVKALTKLTTLNILNHINPSVRQTIKTIWKIAKIDQFPPNSKNLNLTNFSSLKYLKLKLLPTTVYPLNNQTHS